MNEDLEATIKLMENVLAKGRPRTVEDFVDDMIHQHRTLSQTLVVAASTRWKGQAEKIKEIYCERASRKDEKIYAQD